MCYQKPKYGSYLSYAFALLPQQHTPTLILCHLNECHAKIYPRNLSRYSTSENNYLKMCFFNVNFYCTYNIYARIEFVSKTETYNKTEVIKSGPFIRFKFRNKKLLRVFKVLLF